MNYIPYVLFGYISGSILYANLFAGLFGKQALLNESTDKNPGTANAFMKCGFICGILTLLGDLFKGILPVHLFLHYNGTHMENEAGFALVLAAPVIGHIFPLFRYKKGGKGIAVTFGCLLGLFPDLKPLLIFAVCFIFFSLIIRISPHFYRTIAAYGASGILMFIMHVSTGTAFGFIIITVAVYIRFHMSEEEREKYRIKLLWKR